MDIVTTLQPWLDVLGAIFTFVLGKLTDVYAVIMAEPILVVPFGIILTMTVIGLAKRIV